MTFDLFQVRAKSLVVKNMSLTKLRDEGSERVTYIKKIYLSYDLTDFKADERFIDNLI